MNSSFAEATAVRRVSDDEFVTSVPDGWQQGRGAYGGLVLGAMARASLAAEPDGARACRCLTGDLCGPVLPGEARIRTEVLRRGRTRRTSARPGSRRERSARRPPRS